MNKNYKEKYIVLRILVKPTVITVISRPMVAVNSDEHVCCRRPSSQLHGLAE